MFSDSTDLRNTLNARIKTSMQRQTTYKILGLKIKASKKKKSEYQKSDFSSAILEAISEINVFSV